MAIPLTAGITAEPQISRAPLWCIREPIALLITRTMVKVKLKGPPDSTILN